MATVLSDIKELTKRIVSLEATVKTLIAERTEMKADIATINTWIEDYEKLHPPA